MKHLNHKVDFCVVGGGLAGICAAIAAARKGAKVAIMQDRPVFGGNASSEIRMWVCGAHGEDNRETGIVEEFMLENYYRNPGLKYPLWDSVLYEKALLEPNLSVFLNCTCIDATMDGAVIKSIKGWQLTTETYHTIEATYFADCSGDSILAPLTGAEFMLGREAKSDFGETIPPDVADKKTMGQSILFQARETTGKTEFIPPAWAYTYPSDADLPEASHNLESNFWGIEVGGTKDSIHDTEELRDELLKIAFGVWDHIKNYGDHGADNWELEWIGFLPGKRESRRYKGKYIITQNHVESGGKTEDIAAFAGWSMDDHFPEGFYYRGGHPTLYHPAPSPWGIPFGSLYSANIENLMFAGRNISATHVAMSSSRVMATCSVIGQAVGTAAALLTRDGITIDQLNVKELQQELLADDCFIPWVDREISPLTQSAKVNCELIRNGKDRGDNNCWKGKAGDKLTYSFDKPVQVNTVRLVFDSDLNRDYDNMPCSYPLVQPKYKLPSTLVKEYTIVLTLEDGSKKKIHVTDNRQRFVRHCVDAVITAAELVPIKTHGSDEFRVFSFELA